MAMASRSIVEAFDVIEDIGFGEVSCFVDAFSNPFLFQAAEKRLRHRVVPAVSAPAHAGFQVVRATKTNPIITAIL